MEDNQPIQVSEALPEMPPIIEREPCLGGCGSRVAGKIPRCFNCYRRDGDLSMVERLDIATQPTYDQKLSTYRNIFERRTKVNGDGLPVIESIPPAYRHAKPSDNVRDWAKSKTALLTISGPTGTGKTHEACGALRVIAFRGAPVSLVKCLELQRFERAEIERVKCIDGLALDDLAARVSPGALATALEIIDHRIDHQRKTVVTTNATFQELAAIDPRLASRLASGTTLKMMGGDRRMALNKRVVS